MWDIRRKPTVHLPKRRNHIMPCHAMPCHAMRVQHSCLPTLPVSKFSSVVMHGLTVKEMEMEGESLERAVITLWFLNILLLPISSFGYPAFEN